MRELTESGARIYQERSTREAIRGVTVVALTMGKRKDVLTTGQVAKICNVAPRTVSKWFDSGALRGYRIPGSKDRRIPIHQLISFMKVHGMPLNGLTAGKTRVLLLDHDADAAAALGEALAAKNEYEVTYAKSAFEAGVAVENTRPDVMVVDLSLPDLQPEQLCRHLRANADYQALKLIAASPSMTEGKGQQALQSGFHAYINKPFDPQRLIDTINRVVANGI